MTHQPAGRADAAYVSFLDGLRAISILTVVGCHIGIPGLSGGYVGVDVFFVISGFLIINQIKDGLTNGRFSIASFYARRILRILPPFFLMYLAVVLISPFVLTTPTNAFDFLRSVALAPLMAINVFFYLRQGYFDIDASHKPLLHTWTLSVEEQFYLVIPLLLVLLFHWAGHRRVWRVTAIVGAVTCVISLVGTIIFTTTEGPNAAFYLMHWRMWEFIIGGFIGTTAVSAAQRLPRFALEIMSAAGLACIILAVIWFDHSTPYPSWRALLPAVGAVALIVSSLAQRHILVARLLSLRWMIAIGLVSYAWYLWHWPILSFLRISRLEERSLLVDLIGGGLIAFIIACVSYTLIERPIRRWKRSGGDLQYRNVILVAGVASGVALAILGGTAAFGGYFRINSIVASNYGTHGELDNGCHMFRYTDVPAHCRTGNLALLMGDSLASSLAPSLTRGFNDLGLTLVYMGRGGCDPLLLAPSQRVSVRRDGCARLLGPFDQIMSSKGSILTLVATPRLTNKNSVELWSELIGQFDVSRTRALLLAPSPIFQAPSLDCVVLSDRHGISRDRCVRSRAEVENDTKHIKDILKRVADSSPGNVRYLDPIDLFCDAHVCRPFHGKQLYYEDTRHLLTPAVDKIWNAFIADFRWVAWK